MNCSNPPIPVPEIQMCLNNFIFLYIILVYNLVGFSFGLLRIKNGVDVALCFLSQTK